MQTNQRYEKGKEKQRKKSQMDCNECAQQPPNKSKWRIESNACNIRTHAVNLLHCCICLLAARKKTDRLSTVNVLSLLAQWQTCNLRTVKITSNVTDNPLSLVVTGSSSRTANNKQLLHATLIYSNSSQVFVAPFCFAAVRAIMIVAVADYHSQWKINSKQAR